MWFKGVPGPKVAQLASPYGNGHDGNAVFVRATPFYIKGISLCLAVLILCVYFLFFCHKGRLIQTKFFGRWKSVTKDVRL
jgi:hypothetical protein